LSRINNFQIWLSKLAIISDSPKLELKQLFKKEKGTSPTPFPPFRVDYKAVVNNEVDMLSLLTNFTKCKIDFLKIAFYSYSVI